MESRAAVIAARLAIKTPDRLTAVSGDPLTVHLALGRGIINPQRVGILSRDPANQQPESCPDQYVSHRASLAREVPS